jgi:hypothetical protein
MRRGIFGLTVVGGAVLLAMAVWPGTLAKVVFGFLVFCFTVPLLGVWFLLVLVLAAHDVVVIVTKKQWRLWGLSSAAVVFGTLGLLASHVPQRVAFGFCASELHPLVDGAPLDEFRGAEINRRVGPYTVDRYAADRRGGVYFRTATGPDGIGPDQMSYGFAYRPNGQGTPFGNARYWQAHLFGEWFTFAVSDDS